MDIKSIIPHREPFLFVDRIVEIDPEVSILTEKTFSLRDNEFFIGHYPGNPITPGVILCEAVFQSAALLISDKAQNLVSDEKVPVLVKIEDARFKAIVRPEEKLSISVKKEEQFGKFSVMSGTIKKSDRTLALRIKFTIALN